MTANWLKRRADGKKLLSIVGVRENLAKKKIQRNFVNITNKFLFFFFLLFEPTRGNEE